MYTTFAAVMVYAGNVLAVSIGTRFTTARRSGDDGLVICTDANFGGSCTPVRFNGTECVTFPEAYQNDVSAISPPVGSSCTVFTGLSCEGYDIDVTYPGIADLGDGNTAFNDRLNSVRCASSPQDSE